MNRALAFACGLLVAIACIVACCLSGSEAAAQSVNGWNLGAPLLAGAGGDAGDPPLAWRGYFYEYSPSSELANGTVGNGWHDLGPAHNDLDAGASPATVTASAVNGYPALTSTGSAWMQSQGTFYPDGGVMTVFTVMKVNSQSFSNAPAYEYTANASSDLGFSLAINTGAATTGNVVLFVGGAATGMYSTFGTWAVVVDQYDLTAVTGSTISHWYFRSRMQGFGNSPGGSVFPTDKLNLFARSGPTNGSSVSIAHTIACLATLTPIEIDAHVRYLEQVYSIEPDINATNSLVIFGDSQASAFQENVPWPALVANQANGFTRTLVSSAAIVGQTMATSYGNRVVQYAASAIPSLPQYAVIALGTNDAANSSSLTPASLEATLGNFVTYLHGQGITKVFATTILPRGGGFAGGQTQAGFETFRNGTADGGTGGYNGLLRSDAATCWGAGAIATCVVIDTGADPTMGCASCYANTTYYTDAIHPTNLGSSTLFTNEYAPAFTAAGLN